LAMHHGSSRFRHHFALANGFLDQVTHLGTQRSRPQRIALSDIYKSPKSRRIGDLAALHTGRRPFEDGRSREQCLCFLVNNAHIPSTATTTETSSASQMEEILFDTDKWLMDDWLSVFQTCVAAVFFTGGELERHARGLICYGY